MVTSRRRLPFEGKGIFFCRVTVPTTANAMVSSVHDRMPVMVHPDHLQWWIDDRRDGEAVRFMLRPYNAGDMDCYRVSNLVNSASNDSPDCLKPA